MNDLELAARRVLAAYGEWAQTVCHDERDPQRTELRRSMARLAETLPLQVVA